jgi:uncharacterized protein involved in outer membrane biogenesis
MKKKILIIVGSVLVVIVVAVVILAANLNKIVNSKKGMLLAQARQQTGRDISIGDVGVTLWPGLGAKVSDVVVGEDPAFGTEPFVRARQLIVNVKLLPLLHKQVEIKRLVLDEPNIVVIKKDAKTFNFTSLVTHATPPAAPGASAGTSAPKNSSMAAVLAYADIKNGTLRYVDQITKMDRTIHDIDFTASNVGIGKKLDAKLAAAVFGDKQDVRINAAAGPLGNLADRAALSATPLDVKFNLDPVAIDALMSFSPPKPGAKPAQPVPGGASGSAELKGTLGQANLESLNVEATLLGAKKPNVKLSASGGPFDFTADSTLVFAHATLKGRLDTDAIPLTAFKMTSTDPKSPPPVLGGDMRANASFEGNLMALAFNGNIDASNATMEQKDASGKPSFVKKAGIPAKASVSGTFRPQHTPGEGIDLAKIDVQFGALTAKGSGRVVPFEGSTKGMNLTLNASTPLKPWNELLPAIALYAVSGDANATVHVTSKMAPGAAPDITGTANFMNVSATVPDMPKPVNDGQGTASFTMKTAHIPGAKFRIGDSRFVMDCDVSSFTPMTATYKLTSVEVKRNDVQAPAPGAKPMPRPEVFRSVVATGNMRETAPTVVENNLTVSSQNGTVTNIDYTDFKADVKMTPTTTTINSYSAKVLGGNVSGSGTMEPKASKFNVNSKIENVNIADYFKYKAPALADMMVGRINLNIELAGQGKDWTQIAKNLSGQGGATIVDGALTNVNIANQIVSGLQGLPMVPPDISSRLATRNPKLFSGTKTFFQNLSSKFQIANGHIITPNLNLATADFALSGDGWFSLDKEMKLSSTLTLSPKMANDIIAEVPMAKYIQGADGRIQVPLDLTGSVLKPTVRVDTADMTSMLQKAAVQQGQQQLQKEVQSGLKGLLNNMGKKSQPPKPAPAPADTTKQPPKP